MVMPRKRSLQFLLSSVFATTIMLAQAQDTPVPNPLAHEAALTTENDAYLFQKHDAYYTNGIFLRLSVAGFHHAKKTVSSYETGQQIYTPLIRKTQSTTDIDRPYCGFLFGRYTRTAFSRKDAVLAYSATLGIVGEASLGEKMQDSYHLLFGYGRFTGWQYQVQNAVGLDLGLSYAATLWEDSTWAKLVPVAQVSVGMNYTYARPGMYFCVGAFEKNSNSALWNARVQKTDAKFRRRSEFFFFWFPELVLQGYNATLQGGLFSKGDGAVLAEPQRVMFQHTMGFCYAGGRLSARLGIVFEDREALGQKTAQQFGSLSMAYRMR